ncbi:hypothetical protein ATANTOWER_022950 [Ataeniobius toweri]|uniref:Uncharacterized protein n=1 Tax=Ataeniobius toweri TaxID=208326 RepID=A0ABU7C3V4_9TELE|nr:hypothetical protein [Ataeniobius toweri]
MSCEYPLRPIFSHDSLRVEAVWSNRGSHGGPQWQKLNCRLASASKLDLERSDRTIGTELLLPIITVNVKHK